MSGAPPCLVTFTWLNFFMLVLYATGRIVLSESLAISRWAVCLCVDSIWSVIIIPPLRLGL